MEAFKKLTKETKFVLFSTPIVLAIIGFMMFSGNSENTENSNVDAKSIEQKKSISEQEKLLQELSTTNDDNISVVLGKENRKRTYREEENKYSVSSRDGHSEKSIWDDLYQDEKVNNKVEENEISEPIKEEKIKVVYVNSTKPKKKATKSSSTTGNFQENVTKEEEGYKRRTTINSSYNSKEETTSNEYIHGVVHNKQEIHNGGEVRIRTTEACIINNMNVPINTYMNGVTVFKKDRVLIQISSFELKGKIIYTNLHIYDKGSEGIYIPGGVNQEIAKDALSNSINTSGTTLKVPYFGSIVTSGGQKKVEDKTIILPEGYKILLKQEEEKN